MKQEAYRKANEELSPEFELARTVIDARASAGLTQEQLARRMDTTPSVIARLESGRTRPSTRRLERLATATGRRLKITVEPEAPGRQLFAEETIYPRSKSLLRGRSLPKSAPEIT